MRREYFSWIRNPMTVIALFVGLTEVAFGVAFSEFPQSLQVPLVWLMVLFPVICALGFFAVLFSRPHHFYSPTDFRSDESYLAAHRTLADLKATVQSATEEREGQVEQPDENLISALINSLHAPVCWYLLKVADKEIPFDEHWDVLARELEVVWKDSVGHDPFHRLLALGYLDALLSNLMNVLFTITGRLEESVFTVHLTSDTRKLLGLRLGGSRLESSKESHKTKLATS